MDEILEEKLSRFENIHNALSTDFKWSSTQLVNSFTSLIYTLGDKDFNKETLIDVQKYIKDNTGMFSHYRGYDRFFIPAMLISGFESPKEAFSKLLRLEDKLHDAGFSKGTYAGFAAYCLLSSCEEELIESKIHKAKLIYDRMREKHFWLTGQDDYPLAVLLSLSEESVEEVTERIESLFEGLREAGFSKSNGLQFLSHIISFSSDPLEEKIQKCVRVSEYLKERKLKITSFHYGTLGLIALVYDNKSEVLAEIVEVVDHLHNIKGFKWLGRETLVLIASGIVMDKQIEAYKENQELLQTSLGISIQAIIAAQTAAMVAAVSAATAAAASSASS